jgi:hypothetical protein
MPTPPTCETDLTACTAPSTFAYRWPGTLFDAHVCDRHMAAVAAAADPLQLDVRPLDGARLEAYQPPGEDEIAHRVVRDEP